MNHLFKKNGDLLTPTTLLLVGFFFLNIFLLPHGLLYTTLLTPFFFISLLWRGKWKALCWYFLISVPLAYYQIKHGAVASVYLKSYLLFTSVAIFTIWAFFFLQKNQDQLGHYFKQITIYNFFFTLLALACFLVPVVRTQFWSFEQIHPAIPIIPRLKMLVYEPSFYAFQLAPIFIFYFSSFAFSRGPQYFPALLMIGFSLLLSLSFGVLAGIGVSILLIIALHLFQLIRRKKIFFATVYLSIIGVIAAVIAFKYMPYNPIVDRVEKILAGHDTSTNGRTWEAFLLAWRIAGETDYFFGAGLGQIKEVGQEIIVKYYNYEGAWANVVRIPNTTAETLASFGILGVISRLVTELGLFFHTKVYQNYYRLMLFTFLFLFQFSGSYLTNIYEYLMWIIVFLPVFPQFDKQHLHP